MINSFYKIKIDPLLSNNSYLYNKEDNRLYLDFMSMYSSLPLGYNHDIFKRDDFKESINKDYNYFVDLIEKKGRYLKKILWNLLP